eukprot:g15626.t1
MAMTTRPYDMWFSLRCLGLMSLFGCLSAIFYPVLWIGVVILSMVPQIGQLYAPPLVILTAFGTVYGLIMIAIYYMNTRGNISALHMAVSVLVASFGLFTASMAEKALEEGRQAEKGTGKWKIQSFSNGRPDLPLVVFVGRMSPEKQVDKIADLVKEANPPGAPELCRFAIIGHGDSWESIHQEIGHRPDVNMPGVVTGEKLASLVASSDIFFSPTVTGTLDLVFIESQAAGIAVVGPRAVAVPLVVTEGVNGCLYTPLDMKDAKRAIKEVIPQLEKMKVEARKNAEANFKWSKSSDEAIQFYKDVLQYTADRAA